MNIGRINVVPEPLVQKSGPGNQKKVTEKTAESFQDIFSRELAGAKQIKVSAHAQRRMLERNITLDRADWEKINSAVNKAESKGARNSLLIHGDLALIVNITNRTLISAMDEESIKEHVFTNIDSAVIIK